MHKHIVTHIFSIDYGLLFFDFKNRSRKQYVDNLNLIFSKWRVGICVALNLLLSFHLFREAEVPRISFK